MSSIFPVNIDYSARDQRAILLRLQGLIRSVFPKWTDFNIATFSNVLLESMAFVGDNLNFYQDGQARELFWSTVTQRINAIRLARGFNFRLPSATASRSTERFSLPSAATSRIGLPAGTRLRTPSPSNVRFQTLAEAEILVGQQQVDVAIEQSEQIASEVMATTGAPNQRITLARAPYLDGSLSILASDGLYQEVDSFLDPDPDTGLTIGPNSRVFVVLSDEQDRPVVFFGNGSAGKIPVGQAVASYRVGGGELGNLDEDEITVLEDLIRDDSGAVAPLSVTNIEEAAGGIDRMSVKEARVAGPRSLRTQTRSVTNDDFVNSALRVRGVARAAMITSDEDPAVAENFGSMPIVAVGARLPSGRFAAATAPVALTDEVHDFILTEYPPTLTFNFVVHPAQLTLINVSVRVHIRRGYDAITVGQDIRAALNDHFAVLLDDRTPNPTADFGVNLRDADGATTAEVPWSDIFNAIVDVPGVRKISDGSANLLLNGLRQSVTINLHRFPAIGTVTIVDVDTGGAI